MILKLIKKVLRKFRKEIKFFLSVNWFKTIYFNFKMLPFEQAKKLPVFFYGKVKFTALNGVLEISSPLSRGMVRFGENLELIKQNFGKAELKISGKLLINGGFSTGNDYVIIIEKNGCLTLNENTYLGSKIKIIATSSVFLGKYCRLGYESQISDSNYHYTIDLENLKVKPFAGKVFIDDYCWIGNRTSILKGTITPKFIIISSNSLLSKDYSLDVKPNSLIGGIPARILKSGIVRIFRSEDEKIIQTFFDHNRNTKEFIYKDFNFFYK